MQVYRLSILANCHPQCTCTCLGYLIFASSSQTACTQVLTFFNNLGYKYPQDRSLLQQLSSLFLVSLVLSDLGVAISV